MCALGAAAGLVLLTGTIYGAEPRNQEIPEEAAGSEMPEHTEKSEGIFPDSSETVESYLA